MLFIQLKTAYLIISLQFKYQMQILIILCNLMLYCFQEVIKEVNQIHILVKLDLEIFKYS